MEINAGQTSHRLRRDLKRMRCGSTEGSSKYHGRTI